MESTHTPSIAQTIAHQLGGRRFALMTGAKNFTMSKDTLTFSLPGGGGFTKDGINRVAIKLEPSDTYTVVFYRFRAKKLTVVASVTDVYFDQLQKVFTEYTGLDTRL